METLENPWLLNGAANRPVPQVFLVEAQRQDGWVQVLLAERPKGSTGWVRQSDVDIVQVPYRVQVSLGAHEIKVFQGTSEIYDGQVAIGAPSTPTPTGKSYIRVLLETPDPTTAYGPYAYGLSGCSDVLAEFNGGDGEIGLHGNNDASVLGKSVTAKVHPHGQRTDHELATMLPLGTPVGWLMRSTVLTASRRRQLRRTNRFPTTTSSQSKTILNGSPSMRSANRACCSRQPVVINDPSSRSSNGTRQPVAIVVAPIRRLERVRPVVEVLAVRKMWQSV